MHIANGLRPDPENRGWVLGWAVLINDPAWDLKGVYATEAEAIAAAAQYPGYGVFYGSHETGTNGFMKAG